MEREVVICACVAHVYLKQSGFCHVYIEFISLYMKCMDLVLFGYLALGAQGYHFPPQVNQDVFNEFGYFLFQNVSVNVVCWEQ